VNVGKRLTTSAPTGAMGMPHESTAAKGESLLNAIVGEVVACFCDYATW
jgi:creatinine amidohydrolase/Fe(II)-dependent formamide hydrolase-like protein